MGRSRIAGPCSTALAAASFLALLPALSGAQDAGAVVRYRLVDRATEEDRDWHVTLEAEGLRAARGPVRLELADWGEWTDVDAYYLRRLDSHPPLRSVEGTRNLWEVAAPEDWDGALRVEYSLATTALGSKAREAHGLLPWRAPRYVMGFSANTLMALSAEGLVFERRLRIEVPEAWTVATGAGGIARGSQECVLPEAYENGLISFGTPVATARRDDAAPPIEVVQWGGGRPVAENLAGFARAFVSVCVASLGDPYGPSVRLIVTEPGFGGTRTDGSIAVGCPASLERHADPYTAHFLGHEIFHDWLGGRLKGPDESMAWFWEGFTEYLSLLHLAKADLISRSWFAARMGDYRESMAGHDRWRDVSYADPGVDWRDPSVEPLAYHGGALIAFALDVELRRAGRPGLVELLRDLGREAGGRYDLGTIRAWLESHGQERFWAEVLAGTRRPILDEDLAFAGFEAREEDVPLTYLGIRIEPEGGFGTVVAIDPEGPAAGTGLAAGDVVQGRSPTRSATVSVGSQVDTTYRYGLELYDPSASACEIHVRRGEEERVFSVPPRLVPGGRERRIVEVPERLERFFR